MGQRIAISAALLLYAISAVSSQEPRRVMMGQDRPIITYLTPNDRHVVLGSPSTPPQRIREAPGETRARFLSLLSDVVLVIRVESVRGAAMRRVETHPDAPLYRWWFVPASDAEANRIISTVTSRVEAALKGAAPITKAGDRFSFEEEYGTATINGVRVDYVTPWLKPLVAGRRYLLFGSFGQDRFFRNEAYEEIAPSTLLQRTILDEAVRRFDEFEQLTMDQAMVNVRRELGN